MKDLALVTWTHTDMTDIFPIYFGEMKKYFPELAKSYVLINELSDDISDEHLQLVNDDSNTYATRWLSCLEHIEEEYILYMQEDFIPFSKVNTTEFERCLEYMRNSECSCLRFIRSDLNELNDEEVDKIYKISHFKQPDLSFTQQAAIWKKDHFIEVMEALNPSGFRDVESQGTFAGSTVMKQLGYYSSFYFDEETNLRGGHYDDKCLPYIATALVAGKWNIGEYEEELDALAEEYDIDLSERGFFN